jgi:hypothetical protein
MIRKLIVVFVLAFASQALLLAQDGKLRGKVTDRETGEALVGATIVVEGTNLGAATDINGDYVVLSIPVGNYAVKASYVGYAITTISNVRINSNLTTTLDFALASEAVQVGAVEIVAERPLIQRNTTNTVRMTTQENIENLPIRGVQNIIALDAGVVQQNGRLYVRGGRDGEIAYYLDGANTTNPITNTQTIAPIQEAIEELQLQAGGYTAEFGGGNSAIVRTTMRGGTSDYHASLSYLTDDFAKPGNGYFGSTSFGFRNGVLTLSGPILNKNFRFFAVGQHNYVRDRSVRFMTPFQFLDLRVDENDSRYQRDANGDPLPNDQQPLLPGPIVFQKNYVPRNYRENNTVQGTINYDAQPYKFRLSGSYNADRFVSGANWPNALANVFRIGTLPEVNNRQAFAELKFNHIVDNKTYYEVGVSWQRITGRTFDARFDNVAGSELPALTVGGESFTPKFLDNWNAYTDSLVNDQLGYKGFARRFAAPNQWSTIDGFRFNDPNAPNNSYSRSVDQAWGIVADVTSQIQTNHELKAGGRFEMWNSRRYTVNNITNAMEHLYGIRGNQPRSYADMKTLEANLAKPAVGNINHIGYDVFGNEVDDGPDAPAKPVFASAYVQNKLEYSDLILNFGLRYERFDSKGKTFPNPDLTDSAFISSLDVIDVDKLVDIPIVNLLLPRISFSFPVTDNTVFYAMYGKYAQMPALNQLYVGNTVLSRTVSPVSRGNAFLTPIGLLMRPERTTQYEMGFRQTLSENFALTMSGFYKDLKDQLSVRAYTDQAGNKLFTAYLNEDFGTVKGLELTFELRRVERFAARVNYTLSDARGTGSNSQTGFAAVEQGIGKTTDFVNPLGFNQTHRGALLLDYRFARNDGGPILEGAGVNALLTFNSGHSYTRIKEPKSLGQASVWNIGVYPLTDPRFSIPAEPINASSTPWVFNIDLNVNKMLWVGNFSVELFVNVLNLLNTKQIINVYPNTGTPYDDAWLTSPLAVGKLTTPNYVDFYKAINLDNRWAYNTTTGNDLFGSPRQVRFGARVEF